MGPSILTHLSTMKVTIQH